MRAFTTAAFAFNGGASRIYPLGTVAVASRIYPLGTVAVAFHLTKQIPNAKIMG